VSPVKFDSQVPRPISAMKMDTEYDSQNEIED